MCQIATSQSYDSPQNKFNPSGSVTQPLQPSKLTHTHITVHLHTRIHDIDTKRMAFAQSYARTVPWKQLDTLQVYAELVKQRKKRFFI